MTRKVRSTAKGVLRTNSQDTASTSNRARRKPVAGDSTIAAADFNRPDQTMPPIPALATPAPTRPPISACELLDGIPRSQVSTFHTIAPISAAKTTAGSTISAAMMPVPTVSATCSPKKRRR